MADAWEVLISGSTLQSGDAWEHLNAQGGGGGGECNISYPIEATVRSILSADIDLMIEANSANALSASTDYEMTAEIDLVKGAATCQL